MHEEGRRRVHGTGCRAQPACTSRGGGAAEAGAGGTACMHEEGRNSSEKAPTRSSTPPLDAKLGLTIPPADTKLHTGMLLY